MKSKIHEHKSSPIKKYLTVTIICVAFGIITKAQQAPPTPPPQPGLVRNTPRPPQSGLVRTPSPPGQLQRVSNHRGTVVKMSTNDDYVYDGFYMLSNSDSLLVKFPARIGNQIVPVLKIGTTVTVNGTLNYTPVSEKEVRMVSLTANGKTVYDARPSTPLVPPAETFVNSTGKISSLQTDREGRVNGFMLDNKTILRLPPTTGSQLTGMVQKGATIVYTGMQKQPQTGEEQ